MKKIILLAALTFSHLSFADFPMANIEDFNANYVDPSGKGSAKVFEFADLSFGENPSFEIEKQAGNLFLKIGEEEFELTDIPLLADDVKNLAIDDVDFSSSASQFNLSVNSLKGEDSDKEVSLGRTSFECKNSGAVSTNEVLDGCLNTYAKLRSSFLSLKEGSNSTFVSNLQVDISKNNLNFYLKYKVGIKGYGKAYFEDNKVKIRLDSVKTGIFSVKSKVFAELEKLQNDQITVSNPWIIIDLAE